jgi:hypothetical protein
LLAVVHRKYERAHIRTAAGELTCGLESSHPRHRHIQYREVDVTLQAPLDRVRAVVGLSHSRRRLAAVLTQARRPADAACGSAPSVRLRSDGSDRRVLAALCCDDMTFATPCVLTPP